MITKSFEHMYRFPTLICVALHDMSAVIAELGTSACVYVTNNKGKCFVQTCISMYMQIYE